MPLLSRQSVKAWLRKFRHGATVNNHAVTTSICKWRGIATRYAKNLPSFLAAVQIRCLALWLKIS